MSTKVSAEPAADSAPGTGRVTRLVRGRSVPAIAMEIVVAVVVAAVVALAVQFVVARLHIPPGTNIPLALTATGAAVVGLVLLAAARAGPRLGAVLTWSGLSALSALPLSLLLVTTRHYLFGISGDQSFRVEYLTRLADSAVPRDFAYADLAPYYPSAWFWIGGRIARITGAEAWTVYKPLAITTMAVTGVLAHLLWTHVAGRRVALAAAAGTVLVGLQLAAYTPYSWLTAALVAPSAVLACRLVRDSTGDRGRWAWQAATIGLVLGTAAITHTQIFWFLVLVLAAVLLDAVIGTRLGRARLARPRRLFAALGVIALASLPLILLVWMPYFLAVLGGGQTDGAAQSYLPAVGATFPLPMLQPTAIGVLAAIGTVWIALRFGSDRTARALGLVVIAGYTWYALSTLALAGHTTLLAFRIEPIITTALVCAAVPAVDEVARLLRSTRGGLFLPRQVTAVVGVAALIALVSVAQAVPSTYSWSTAAQESDFYPDGTKPVGAVSDADDGRWIPQLFAAVDTATGLPPDQVVVLSTYAPLFVYRPYWTFQTTVAQYANPLADYNLRNAMIRQWATSTTPTELLTRLDESFARPPSVFVLRRTLSGLQLTVTSDAFPLDANTRTESVTFSDHAFDDPAFIRTDVGPFAVIVRRGAPPVP